jgi:hypothetical protein
MTPKVVNFLYITIKSSVAELIPQSLKLQAQIMSARLG